MKKPYNKPRMYAETFQLLEHISSCAVAPGETTVNYRDKNSCSYIEADIALFYNSGRGCLNNYSDMFSSPEDFLASLDPEDSGGCYNAFSNGNVFAS